MAEQNRERERDTAAAEAAEEREETERTEESEESIPLSALMPRKKAKSRDEEEPAVRQFELLGYDLDYPIEKKRKKKKQKQIDYAKRGSGKLIFHAYDNADCFSVKVNGKKFDYRHRNLPVGEIRIVVKSSFRIAKWYAFLIVFADFFRMLLGMNNFGGYFSGQGVVDYEFEFTMTRRPAAKDVHVWLEKELRVDGYELQTIDGYVYRALPKLQKRYDRYSKFAVPVLCAPFLIALIAALAYFFITTL